MMERSSGMKECTPKKVKNIYFSSQGGDGRHLYAFELMRVLVTGSTKIGLVSLF